MALGVISGTSLGTNPLFNLKSGSPISTQHHGALLSEYASFTQLAYFKPREMLEAESDGSQYGWQDKTVYRKVSLSLRPWALNGWVDGHQAFFSAKSVVSVISQSASRGSASQFEAGAYGPVGSNTVSITSNDATQSDQAGWDDLALEDRWLMQAFTFDYPSKTFNNYLIDPSDGSILQKRQVITPNDYSGAAHSALAVPSDPGSRFSMTTAYHNNNGGVQGYTDYDLLIAEVDYWNRALSEAELIAFSQVGFAEVNNPTGLVFSANFMRNWEATSGTKQEIISSGGDASNVWISTRPVGDLHYVVDNPVPVYLMRDINIEHDFIELGLFSATAGTAKVSAYPAGTPKPSEINIFNGVDAVSQVTVQPDGLGEITTSMTGLDTGTEYVLYSVQDELDGGSFGSIAELTITTPTKYSEIITDVTGAEVTEQSGIQWAWFDEENPSTLASPSTQGVAELTDATGLLEITLPTSITTPKGSKGTMVLRADWGGGVQTASHLVEVK